MRSSLYLIGFAAASIVGAGAVGFGCSSSSSGGTTSTDAGGSPEATTTDEGGGDTGVTDDGGGDAAAACTLPPVKVGSFDSGSPAWACYQANCTSALTMCDQDCTCASGIFGALECSADGGASATMSCFVTAFGNISSGTAGMAVEACVVAMMSSACAATPPTDGGDASTPTDSSTPADTGAGDTGVSDTGAGPG